MNLTDVERALAAPRPGREAQVRMSPRPRPGDVFPLPPEINPKEAGVLILLYPANGELHFFLTRRTETVETHKGQISLPGGSQEEDETLEETAVREASEELGIDVNCIRVLGEPLTSLFIPVSGFRATPFVAFTPMRPNVTAEPGEVDGIIDVPLESLLDDKNVVEEEWEIRGFKAHVPFFSINGHKVWGATAMILGEFRAMLKHARRPTVLILIRHASNDYLKENRLAGWVPGVHLNEQGKQEADALARRLAHIPIDAMYASPLERAIETANAVAQNRQIDLQILPALGDTRVGEWEGKLIKEVDGTETWKQLQSKPVGVKIGGGESIDEVQARMVAAIEDIVARHRGKIITVFSHADPIKSVVAHYLKMDLNEFQRIAINPASATVFFFNSSGAMLFRLNDNGELPSFKPEKES